MTDYVMANATEKHHVRRGLVDKGGAFFLLLDSDQTKYFRFSDESDGITELYAEVVRETQINERAAGLIEEQERTIEKLKRTIKRREADISALREQIRLMKEGI